MHHRMQRCYSAAMTAKNRQNREDRWPQVWAKRALHVRLCGMPRYMRSAQSLSSNGATVLGPQHVASWGMRRGIPSRFFEKQNEQFLAPSTILRMAPLPAFAGAEPESGHPSKSRRFEWELCEPREGGRGFGENESMWRAARSDTRCWKEGGKGRAFYRLPPHPTLSPASRRERVASSGRRGLAMNSAGERVTA
jgi:hypothetical protein